MSGYAVKNLLEVEPMEGLEGLDIRFSRKYLESTELGVTYERFDPGFVATDGHRHEVQEEAYVVIEGSGDLKLDDERIPLRKWDVVRVAPEVVRGFDSGPDGLVVIAIGSSKPEKGDGIIVKGRWPETN